MSTAFQYVHQRVTAVPTIVFLAPLFWPLLLTPRALGQSIEIFDADPAATSTAAPAINVRGDVVGSFNDAIQQKVRCYLRDRDSSITVFDISDAAAFSTPTSMNSAGVITGYFFDENRGQDVRGFIKDRDGAIVVFDADPAASQTEPFDINESGEIAGRFGIGAHQGFLSGFVRDRDGVISQFDADPSGLTNTTPTAINARGDATGHFFDPSQQKLRGFVRDPSGAITIFDADPAAATIPQDLNNRGDIVGSVQHGGQARGFLRDHKGNISIFDADPSAVFTFPSSINARGQAVGVVRIVVCSLCGPSGVVTKGFLRDPKGTITLIQVDPAATFTSASSINESAEITGVWGDPTQGGRIRGFVRSPK